MQKPLVVVVSPALAQANNGNWQTAWRWSRALATRYRTQIVSDWPGSASATAAQLERSDPPVAMLALHARRSAASIAAWARSYPGHGLAVVLTGTDLYRDIQTDDAARHSLALAQKLVVLQELGPQMLPPNCQQKTELIFQSTRTRQTLGKSSRHVRALMVGHLREEKSPQTLMQAAHLVTSAPLAGHPSPKKIYIDHIGSALDPVLGAQAMATARDCPLYRWLGGVDHETTRRHIQRAHVLVNCSRMEGGAHVLMEAVCSGTPVLASRIDGNVGMLGADYLGYFPWGDAQSLADLLRRCRDDPGFLPALKAQCDSRTHLFKPESERAALLGLVDQLVGQRPLP
jgi:putative glycosyltransferase (TIGR04348 family)